MCRRIVRDPVTGNRNFVNSTFLNLGTLETSGIDVQASWSVDPAELGFSKVPGTVSIDILFNRLLDFGVQSFPTSPVLDSAGTFAREGLFDYRALTTLRYSVFRCGRGAHLATPAVDPQRSLRRPIRSRRSQARARTICLTSPRAGISTRPSASPRASTISSTAIRTAWAPAPTTTAQATRSRAPTTCWVGATTAVSV